MSDSSTGLACGAPKYFVRRVLGVSLAAAFAGALIYVSMGQGNGLLWQFIAALFYSISIAVPSSILLNALSETAIAQRPWASKAMVAAVLVVTATVGSLIAGLMMIAVGMLEPAHYWAQFARVISISMIITLTFGFSTSLYEGVRGRLEATRVELQTREAEQQKALKLLAEARLSSLESRIHPHFLFNTLNSIASLIPSDPARAEAMVGKLASLLRFSLNANQVSLAPLGQELKVVRDYLEIEKARFGARLDFSIEAPAELELAGVPPLSVQTLVENSVKHAIAPKPGGGSVRVTAGSRNGTVWVEVSDTGPGFSIEAAPVGHGLDNLTSRLKLLFGDEASLEAARIGGHAVVRMSAPRRNG